MTLAKVLISIDFKLVSGVKTSPTVIRQTYQGGPTVTPAVRVPNTPFRQVRSSHSSLQHFLSKRQRRSARTGATPPVSGLRHCRPWHFFVPALCHTVSGAQYWTGSGLTWLDEWTAFAAACLDPRQQLYVSVTVLGSLLFILYTFIFSPSFVQQGYTNPDLLSL